MENNKKILIVEDEAPLRNALRDKLTREGFVVLEAKNGEEGLEVALREHPGLILLDLLMPGMTGFQLLAQLRKDTWGKDVKVIVISNLPKEDNDLIVAQQLVFDYLNKADHTLEEVCARVRLLLSV
ncbi:MAG: response regulator [Ignavibacteriaceae bacterium]